MSTLRLLKKKQKKLVSDVNQKNNLLYNNSSNNKYVAIKPYCKVRKLTNITLISLENKFIAWF